MLFIERDLIAIAVFSHNGCGFHHLCLRCVLETSVSDPDPDWIRIQSGPWIRVRIQGQESKEEKMYYI